MRSYGWGFRLLTAFAAEWWGPPEETGGDGRRREASPQSHPRFAAAHTPVYAGACTIPRNAPALSGTPIPPVSVPLLASVARNPLMCGGCRHLTAPHCGFALCVAPHTALLRRLCVFAPHCGFALCVAPHTAASPCAGLLGFCPFGTAQGKSLVLRLTSRKS